MTRPVEVTVLTPVYNGQTYLREAIDSVLAQTLEDLELLIIDDASTDDSRDIVRSYDDARIRLVCNDENLGIARTANRGLDLANGKYVAMLDQDDWAHPERLRRQLTYMEEHRDHAVVGSWTMQMDERSQLFGRIARRPVAADEAQAQLLFRCPIQHSSCMGRTELLRRYRYREGYPVAQDFDLFLRLSESYRLGSLPEVLTLRRRHPAQTTQRNIEQETDDYRRIFRTQLLSLGIDFEAIDLERHLLLRRASGFSPDLAYLSWARSWFRRLKDVNSRAGYYPEPAFSRVVRDKWFKTCRRTTRSLGRNAWEALGRPLRYARGRPR